MPGHKTRMAPPGGLSTFALDVTEINDFDDLSYPRHVLKDLEEAIASLYGVKDSIISLAGGTGGLLAAILSISGRGTEILVPLNAHRSIVHALILSGLRPRWYEPAWNSQWGLWDAVDSITLESAILNGGSQPLAAVVITSPTFAGAVSDIQSLSALAHKYGLPVIVDEAHGAHFIGNLMPASSCRNGADLVVHSFHKTLGALSQTGAVHVVSEEYVRAADVRACMRLVATSSPSYVLLASIEQSVLIHQSDQGREGLESLFSLAQELRERLQKSLRLYAPERFDLLHILIGCGSTWSGRQLDHFLGERGVYCEAVLGSGALLLLGAGSEARDCVILEEALAELPESAKRDNQTVHHRKPSAFQQLISPREAFFAPSELIEASRAAGKIAADCWAPCPPGMPLFTPGALITEEAINHMNESEFLRVLLEPD